MLPPITKLMSLNVGDRLGHYDVTALIGEGGMGQVYQATDTQLNRQVALKILPDAFASDSGRPVNSSRQPTVSPVGNAEQLMAHFRLAGVSALFIGGTFSVFVFRLDRRMGFLSPADYLDIDLVMVGLDSTWWFIVDLIHLGVGAAALTFACALARSYIGKLDPTTGEVTDVAITGWAP